MPRTHRKPIIWAFSLSKLNALLASVVPQYAAIADIRVFHKGFEEALTAIRDLTSSGEEVDVLMGAGMSGAYLRGRASAPVVLITPTGFDVLQALSRARRLSPRIGIITFGEIMPELQQFRVVYQLDIEQRAYLSHEDAATGVRELAARGVEVIVGPGIITDLAEQAGIRGVFLYSQSTVHDAFRRAIDIARIARNEEAKRERIDTILAHLAEGVVAVDMEERIQSINPAMRRLVETTVDKALGVPLSRIAPTLGLTRVLESGAPELERIQRFGKRTLVTNRIPLREQGVSIGAVLTCQDASAIERVDRSLRSEHRPRRFVARYELADLIGDSGPATQARALAARYARTDATVLVTGESGTGKEVCAQGIHNASARRDRPFVAINCAAFPEALLESELFGYEEGAFTGSRRGGKAGLFEAAHTGSIFLDEVGEVPLPLQTRLLRVLQEREVLRLGASDPTPVDVRVIAATNRDLAASVADGTFRKDLYYRLNILQLHIAPLAARREDIPAVATHLLDRALDRHRAMSWRTKALALLLPRLQAYAWPGNVREMENVLERVAVLYADPEVAAGVDAEHLSSILPELFPAADRPAAPEARRGGTDRDRLLRVLQECGGNQSAAARRLGMGRTTLWRKLTGRT